MGQLGILSRTVAVQMLNRRGVAPDDFVGRHAEHLGNLLPLGWAGCPAA